MTGKTYQGDDASELWFTYITTAGPNTTAVTTGAAPILAQCDQTITTTGGRVVASFTGMFQHSAAAATIVIELRLNGALWNERRAYAATANQPVVLAMEEPILAADVPAGTHTLRVYFWSTTAGTTTSPGGNRSFVVTEHRR